MFYLVVGVFGATVGVVFSALPEELVLATAGLALLGAIGTSLAVALTVESSNKQVEGKQVEGKQVEGKQVEGKQVEGKQVEGKQVEGKQVEGKQVKNQRDAALVTFLVTASGVTLLGIGSAFWGLLAGVLVTGLRRIGLS